LFLLRLQGTTKTLRMKVSLSLNELHELFEEFKQKAGASYHTDGSETVLELPSSWGSKQTLQLIAARGTGAIYPGT
jgi:6-phosphogluconate dehydrogenase